MSARILWLDEDLVGSRPMLPILEREGYEIDLAPLGQDALHKLLLKEHDLVILGMSHDKDHWQFCSRLVALDDAPLLLLLASGSDRDLVRGLDLGADDCLAKPPSSIEFAARVRALLRRRPSQAERQRRDFFVDGDLSVDLTRQEVRIANRPVALTRTEFKILACLVKHPDEVMSQQRLMTEVWGHSEPQGQGSLKQYIHFLRKKLEPDPAHPQRIVTHWGEGYLLRRLAADGQGSGAEWMRLDR
jgi:DNA-binding response OmpR family regulator